MVKQHALTVKFRLHASAERKAPGKKSATPRRFQRLQRIGAGMAPEALKRLGHGTEPARLPEGRQGLVGNEKAPLRAGNQPRSSGGPVALVPAGGPPEPTHAIVKGRILRQKKRHDVVPHAVSLPLPAFVGGVFLPRNAETQEYMPNFRPLL